MSYSTGTLPIPTTDTFSQAGAVELRCYGAHSILLTITNAAVVCQIAEHGGRPDSDPIYSDSFYFVPGVYPINSDEGTDAIRVRSATPGTPANVAIAALP